MTRAPREIDRGPRLGGVRWTSRKLMRLFTLSLPYLNERTLDSIKHAKFKLGNAHLSCCKYIVVYVLLAFINIPDQLDRQAHDKVSTYHIQ
jgi:hypothetical protein